MSEQPANDEMVQGFVDGYDLTAPEPSANRSASYRHGFMCGRKVARAIVAAKFAKVPDEALSLTDLDVARAAVVAMRKPNDGHVWSPIVAWWNIEIDAFLNENDARPKQ